MSATIFWIRQIGPLVVLLAWLVLLPAAVLGQRERDQELAFERKAEQLEAIVLRRPRKGTAFDLWVRHYQDADRQDALVERVTARLSDDPDDARLHLMWGLLSQELGLQDEAIEAFQAAKALSPDDYYARMLLADELLRRQRLDEAIAELSETIRLAVPRQDYLRMGKQLASAYQQIGELDEAQRVWRQLADRFATDVRVLSELATAVGNEGHVDQALQLWNRVLELAANDPFQRFTAQQQIAEIYLREGANEQALSVLEPLLDDVDPTSWRAENMRRLIERATLAQAGTPGLVEFWQARSTRHPNDLNALAQLAKALALDKQGEAAERVYRRALERAPKNRELHEGLLSLLMGRSNSAAAIAQAELLSRLYPRDIDVWWRLGQLYLRGEDQDEKVAKQRAIEAWKNIADLQPNDAAAAVRVAEACRAAVEQPLPLQDDRNIRLDEDIRQREALLLRAAEKYYREAIRRDPKAAQYKEYLGEFFHWLNRPQDAVAQFLRMAESDSDREWHDVSQVLARFEYVNEAILAAQKAVDRNAENVEYRKQLIELLVRAGRHTDARETLNRWADKSDDDRWEATAIQLRVEVAIAAGDVADEIKNLRREISSSPDSYPLHWTLARLLSAVGRTHEAAEAMSRAVRIRPEDSRLRREFAQLLTTANQLDQAVAQYGWLIEAEPARNRDDLQRIIDLELRQNHLDDAGDAARRLVQVAPGDSDSHLLKATVAMRQGKLSQRVAALRRAVRVAPRDLQMRRQLASALRDDGRLREALKEAYQCFDLAESLEEKLSILTWTLDWASGISERKWLLERVRQERNDQSKSFVMSMSLVHVLANMNRHDEALRELRRLQIEHPTNVVILTDLVRLAEILDDLQAAVEYQEQLVKLTALASDMEHLARLYRQADRLEDAAAIWDDLLEKTTSNQQSIATVDRLLQQGDLFQAQRFAEAGLARFPDSWQLAYRTGLIHLAAGQRIAARSAFVLVLRTAAQGTNRGRTAFVPNVYQDISLSLTARQMFREIRIRVERHGAQNLTTLRRFFDAKLLKAGGSNSLSAAKAFSAIALLSMAHRPEESVPWLDGLQEGNPSVDELRLALRSAWCTYRAAECRRLMTDLRNLDAKDPLPAILWLLDPPRWDAETINESLHTLNENYEWLASNRPDLVGDFRSLYIARLFHYPDRSMVAEQTQRLIQRADAFGDLPPLIPLVHLADGSLTAPFFQRSAELFPRDRDSVGLQPLASTLRLAIDKLNWDDLKHVEMVENLFDALILDSEHFAGQAPATANDPFERMINQLSDEIANLAKEQRTSRRLDSHSRPNGAEVNNRAWIQMQRDVLRSQTTGSFIIDGHVYYLTPPLTSNFDEARWFPTATPQLSASQIELLAGITRQMAENGHAQRWLEHLESSAKVERAESIRFRLAQIISAWYLGRESQATEQLKEMAANDRSDVQLAQLLVRALLQQGKLAGALSELNQITGRDRSWQDLRFDIARLWSQRALRRTLDGHTGTVTALAFSPDGRTLASTSVDHTVKLWDVSTGELLRSRSAHGDIVLAAAFAPGSDLLATAGYDQQVRLWRPEDLSSMGMLSAHSSAVRALAFSPDGRWLATAGDDRLIVIWNVESQEPMARLSGHRAAITALSFSPEGMELAAAGADGVVRMWDLTSREPTTKGVLGDLSIGAARSVVHLDVNRLAVGYDRESFAIWSRDSKSWRARTYQAPAAVRSIAFHRANNQLALGLDNHAIQLRDPNNGEEQMILNGHAARILSVAYSPAGDTVATGGFDSEIKLWQVTGQD